MKRLPELRLPARTAWQFSSGPPQLFPSVSSRRVLCLWIFVGVLSASLAVTLGFRIGSRGTTSPATGWRMCTRSRCGCTSLGHPAGTTVAQRTPLFPGRHIHEIHCLAKMFSSAVCAGLNGWSVALVRQYGSLQAVQQQEGQVVHDLQSQMEGVPKTAHEDVSAERETSQRDAQRCGPTDKQLGHLAKRLALPFSSQAGMVPSSTDPDIVKFTGQFWISQATPSHRIRSLFRSWYFLLGGVPDIHILGRSISEGTPVEVGTEDYGGSDQLNETPCMKTMPAEYPPLVDHPDETACLLPLDNLRSDSPKLFFSPEHTRSGKAQDALESGNVNDNAPCFGGRFYRLGRFSALAQLNEKHPIPG
ncbi:putative transmembrane protein [Toxoplasma gondii TgCatPRC2]|uniref:Transmembrane protein n=4 Tax=Toxoplasma gondii TaxID=5811 RepID=S8ETB5_TOXGM|nr:hypothetical protein TGME49_236630 [Toxoplasma gondii ME49]EPT26656.1 hypothetical protein TGME49_236630 [Toxoplasma gondii ME49]KFG31706.1 putative transmembrane protein [Toxoplasma gondii GAB2-2007-GAL-DOM2]KYF43065.1 hypothetical protein TGARI_236630 [Toxoplasma gondii ARI]KYK67804.1 putative transmembrane protein [Toxoplasma gondii TgCatPRC2]|eukprot:XP_002369026.1 hypothetical protein TGME49_236630 [Toxoplasma gondii ME49]